MKLRTWPILALASGSLLALIILTGLGALRRARQIYTEISAMHENYRKSERILSQMRSEVHLSGLLLRDYLLDPSHITAAWYRGQLLAIHSSMSGELDQLRTLIGSEDTPQFARLRAELEAYWASCEPVFEWNARQKMALSSLFLRKQVLPRRDAVLSMAREIRTLNQAGLERQQRAIGQKQRELPVYVGKMLAVTLLLGLAVAAGGIYRVTRLERRSEAERRQVELAERELHRLSQQLVRAHEEERRSISRELHDEVGQMLTALRMDLAKIERLRAASDEQFHAYLEGTRRLCGQALRAVRDLALGLRPSMLDDLGLGPALEWQARDFSRRSGVPVAVQLDGPLDALPDSHRTCVYRVVQEALTNCARHAQAREIRVTVHGRRDFLLMTIQDDGVGFDPSATRRRGLGLLGIEERVRELGGTVTIHSQPGKGAVLSAQVPLDLHQEHAAG